MPLGRAEIEPVAAQRGRRKHGARRRQTPLDLARFAAQQVKRVGVGGDEQPARGRHGRAADRAGQTPAPADRPRLGVQAQDHAALGPGVERLAVEGEGRLDAVRLGGPQRLARAQAQGVHPALRRRLRRCEQPVLVEQRAAVDRAPQPRPPQHLAALAAHEHDRPVHGADGEHRLSQRRGAADGAAGAGAPEGSRVGVQGLRHRRVVPGVAQVRRPGELLAVGTEPHRRHAGRRVDSPERRH